MDNTSGGSGVSNTDYWLWTIHREAVAYRIPTTGYEQYIGRQWRIEYRLLAMNCRFLRATAATKVFIDCVSLSCVSGGGIAPAFLTPGYKREIIAEYSKADGQFV